MAEPHIEQPDFLGLPTAQLAHAGNLAIAGEPGPESLVGRLIGDTRYTHLGLTGLGAGVLQLMHPEVGAGVWYKSPFFKDPWGRIDRSIPEIVGTVCDADADATGLRVRNYHIGIFGHDENGDYYNALNPWTFRWTQYTFIDSLESLADRVTDLDLAGTNRQEPFYQGALGWAKRFQVNKLGMPATYGEFREDWHKELDETLTMTPAADKAITMALDRDIPRYPSIPPALWPLLKLPVSNLVGLMTIGGLPEEVREKHGIPFSTDDAAKLKLLDSMIRDRTFQHLPAKMRLHPRTRRGIADRKARAELLDAMAA